MYGPKGTQSDVHFYRHQSEMASPGIRPSASYTPLQPIYSPPLGNVDAKKQYVSSSQLASEVKSREGVERCRYFAVRAVLLADILSGNCAGVLDVR